MRSIHVVQVYGVLTEQTALMPADAEVLGAERKRGTGFAELHVLADFMRPVTARYFTVVPLYDVAPIRDLRFVCKVTQRDDDASNAEYLFEVLK